mgnify:FL=1
MLFHLLSQNSLTPNQLSILYHINAGETIPFNMNIHLEMRLLIGEEWLIEGSEYSLAEKAKNLLEELEKPKTVAVKSDPLFDENCLRYNMLFPKITLGSKKPARTHIKTVTEALRWFIDNYEYTWDVILGATDLYLQQEERSGWKYTRTSQYFIRKQNNGDKTFSSDLANYCELFLGGEETAVDLSSDNVFT